MEKKKTWIVALIIVIVLLLLIILYLLFGREKSFTVTFDSNGGTKIADIKVEDGEVVKLPEAPKKEGYKFLGWTTDKGKVVTKGTKFTSDTKLEAKWVSADAELITVTFDDQEVEMEKGKEIILPVNPVKEGYIFIGWKDADGNYITDGVIYNENVKLIAIWIKEGVETITIKYDKDNGSKIGSIVVENGKVIILPIAPTKEGYVFNGWYTLDGKEVTKDYVVDGDLTIKASWKKPYKCPKDCTPIGDGSKCNKVVTTKLKTITTCAKGYTLKDGYCVDMSTKYHAETMDKEPWWTCNNSDYYMYTHIEGMGAEMLCVKKGKKETTKGCPSGYTKDGDICKKTETKKCSKN